MSHDHIHRFALPFKCLGKTAPDFLPVDIAPHALQRFEVCESFRDCRVSEISRVPYFITLFEMPENGFVQPTVSVRNEADPFHAAKTSQIASTFPVLVNFSDDQLCYSSEILPIGWTSVNGNTFSC